MRGLPQANSKAFGLRSEHRWSLEMHVAMHVNTRWEHARSDLLMIRSLRPDFKYWPHCVTANHDSIGPYYECGERQTLLQCDMVNVAPRTPHDHSSSLQHVLSSLTP